MIIGQEIEVTRDRKVFGHIGSLCNVAPLLSAQTRLSNVLFLSRSCTNTE